MFILFADFIFKSVFITLKVTNLELFFYHWVLALYFVAAIVICGQKFKFLVNAFSCTLTKNKQELVNTGLVKIMFNYTLFCLHFFTKPDSKCTFGCSHYAKHFLL